MPTQQDNAVPDPIHHQPWQSSDVIKHAFFTRHGGVSSGIYASLNAGIGSNDKAEHVIENRARMASYLDVDPQALVSVHQVHSSDVVTVNAPIALDKRPKADAMVTAKPYLALGVLTADCGPLLFYDGTNGVIGAAHAGWKGAIGGVLEATLDAMEDLGAARATTEIVLGPTISGRKYEVGAEFKARFIAQSDAYRLFFAPSQKPDHAMFNLPAFLEHRAQQSGVRFTWTGHCTYADPDRFFSYRRTTHHREPDYGRQLSAITLKG